MGICKTLRRYLAMLTEIYLNLEWVLMSLRQRRKLKISFNYVRIPENVVSKRVVLVVKSQRPAACWYIPGYLVYDREVQCNNSNELWCRSLWLNAVQVNWFCVNHALLASINAWLEKDYRSPGMMNDDNHKIVLDFLM